MVYLRLWHQQRPCMRVRRRKEKKIESRLTS
jgi:hypothetical protein